MSLSSGARMLAEDAVDFGAGGFDRGDDDGDAGVGLLGETGAQPAGAGGEFGVLVGALDEGEAAARGWRLAASSSICGAGGADGLEQGYLRGRFGVEADEQIVRVREARCCAAMGGAEGFGSWASVRYCARAQRRSNSATQRAKARVSELPGKDREALAAAVVVQQLPGVGGGLGERVDGAQAGGGGVGGDDCAPEGVLLRGAEQQVGCAAFEQEAVPEAVVQVSHARIGGGCQTVQAEGAAGGGRRRGGGCGRRADWR